MGPPWNAGCGDTERVNFGPRSAPDYYPRLPPAGSAGPGWAEFQPASNLGEANHQLCVVGDPPERSDDRSSSEAQAEAHGRKRRREEGEKGEKGEEVWASIREEQSQLPAARGEGDRGSEGDTSRDTVESGAGREVEEGRQMEKSREREEGRGVEEGGEEMERSGEWRGRVDGREESDSDVDSIIATFCSSPSTDND